eukprot:sb/3477283/
MLLGTIFQICIRKLSNCGARVTKVTRKKGKLQEKYKPKLDWKELSYRLSYFLVVQSDPNLPGPDLPEPGRIGCHAVASSTQRHSSLPSSPTMTPHNLAIAYKMAPVKSR